MWETALMMFGSARADVGIAMGGLGSDAAIGGNRCDYYDR